MKRSLLSCLVLIFLSLIPPVYASVELRATIGQEITVSIDFRDINSTVYETLKAELEADETKIPEIIRGNLVERNLTDVQYYWEPADFNDADRSISVRFYLSGSDILNLTLSEEKMKRIYHVRTDWRTFELNTAEGLSLDFTEYFGVPMSVWNFENETYPTYYYNYTDTSSFDPTCCFILPKEATGIRIEEDMDTIVFELPLPLGESLLNSPFLILGTIIVGVIVASLYRTIRKSEEQKVES